MILTAAPLRISLGGGGTDLPSYYRQYGGFVVSSAIDWFIYALVNHTVVDDRIRLKYAESEEVETVEDIAHDLIRNALKATGIKGNVEITTVADMPERTGLGSSGTYLVALMLALAAYLGHRIRSQEALAEMAYYVERTLSNHIVGKHDPYLAAFGGMICLTVAQDGSVVVEPLDLDHRVQAGLQERLLLFYTDIQRSSQPILVSQSQQTSSGSPAMIENLHEIKRIGYKVVEALRDGNLAKFGNLLDWHWQVKKQRSPLMSGSDIDRWYIRAKDEGATGGKIVGAGGGGVLMVYVQPAHQANVRAAMREEGLRELVYQFEPNGAKLLLHTEPKEVRL